MEKHVPLWKEEAPLSRTFPQLESDIEVDVVIVGGGLTGAMAAYYLADTGKRVALFEKDVIGGGETSYTTAFLTQVHDTYLHELLNYFSPEETSATWWAQQAAIDEIEYIAQKEKIECEFKRCNAYIFADSLEGERTLHKEYAAAKTLGFHVRMGHGALGFKHYGYLCVEHQAKYNPIKFTLGVLSRAYDRGVQVFEHTEIFDYVGHSPVTLKTRDGHTIRAQQVIVATHNPNFYEPAVHLRLRPMQTYVLEAHIPHAAISEHLFWDTHDPYHYFRVDAHDGYDRMIVGGEDHPTGEKIDTDARYLRLEQYLRMLLPNTAYTIARKWSGQVIETADGMPMIGPSLRNHALFLCTGYAGNGMTFSVVAAMMARDAIMGYSNVWSDAFSIKRLRNVWGCVRANLHTLKRFLTDRVRANDSISTEESTDPNMRVNTGRVIHIGGKHVAQYTDSNGVITRRSAVCTHLKCIVQWNSAEKTWDCPCHGSRFTTMGEVLSGPARMPLEKIP